MVGAPLQGYSVPGPCLPSLHQARTVKQFGINGPLKSLASVRIRAELKSGWHLQALSGLLKGLCVQDGAD